MKYRAEKTVEAVYGEIKGNPFLEAVPEMLGKEAFWRYMKSSFQLPVDIKEKKAEERRAALSGLGSWFLSMDYMYSLYDMLYRAMVSTYQTKGVIESIRQMNQIHVNFRTGKEADIPYATQAFSGAVLGVPGIGKTATIQRCLSAMPQVIVHRDYQGKPFYTKQILYLSVECPSDCSVKTLAFNILSAIDTAIGSDYFEQISKGMAASAVATKLKIVCMNHHIGLIVIDEIQNAVLTAVKNKQVRQLVKFLVELTNETATGICFCGTLEAEEVFLNQEHLKRRTRGFRLLPMKYDVTYRRFLTQLWEYQTVLHKTELTEKLLKQIYDLSAGIPAYIVKLFTEAQVQAILSGKEKLSYEGFKTAVSMLGIEVPKVYSRGGTSISDFVVEEVEIEEEPERLQSAEWETGFDTETVSVAEPETTTATVSNTVSEESGTFRMQPSEPEEASPAKRFYASKRGRKKAERDRTDLLIMWESCQNPEHMWKALESFQMTERRWF